jgi:hypothetical protein
VDLQLAGAIAEEKTLESGLHNVFGVHLATQRGIELAAGQADELAHEALKDFVSGRRIAGAQAVHQVGEEIAGRHRRGLSSGPGIFAPFGHIVPPHLAGAKIILFLADSRRRPDSLSLGTDNGSWLPQQRLKMAAGEFAPPSKVFTSPASPGSWSARLGSWPF